MFAFYKHVDPIHQLRGPDLPASWHSFSNGKSEIMFKDELKYCEDACLDRENSLALLSCDPGRPQWNTVMGTMYNPEPHGAIHIYDYVSNKDLKPLELIDFPPTADFHPLGINIYRSENSENTRLFVVNHQRQGSTIDIFDLDYQLKQAKFITSISDNDRNILSPNAISPTSYNSFYVSNDHRFIPRLQPLLNKLETFLRLPLSWVTYVDFTSNSSAPSFITVASHIPYANGLTFTPTGKEVIIASTGGKRLLIYDRDPNTNLLTFQSQIPMTFLPDNVNFDDSLSTTDLTAFDQDGRFLRGLIVAGPPSPLAILAVAKEPTIKVAPSWIVEVRRGSVRDVAACTATPEGWEGDFHLRSLYQSNGSHFSTSSTGAMDHGRRRLIVTGLYAEGILDISWPEENLLIDNMGFRE